jgi:hypothetical protein
MIKELFLATVLSTSFSVRTPNDNTKPLDYEFSIKAEDKMGKFTYNLKRDWERELGEKYVDDVFKFSHNGYDVFYYGVDYVDKESKDISYITKNFGVQHPIGLKIGVSVKDNDELFSTSFTKKLKKGDLEYFFNLSIKTDLSDNQIFNLKSDIKKWLTKNINVFGLYKHEYYNEKEDFQFKVGLGVKL